MSDEPNKDKTPGDEPPKNLMLLERLGNLGSVFAKTAEADKEKEGRQLPLAGKGFCAICKSVRLDNDPTGVTCGDPQCISRALEALESLDATEARCNEADAMQGVLEIVASMLNGAGPEDKGGISKLCENIEDEAIPEVNQALERICAFLGIAFDSESSLVGKLDEIEEKVIALGEAISSLEKNAKSS